MAKTDWYRKTTWTVDDQNDFFGRLRKARSSSRSQYLHIQAYHLMETGRNENIAAALSLLDSAIVDYPNPIHLETDYFLKAKCYEALGRIEDAIGSYKGAIEARSNKTSMRTEAPLYYAYFVVSHNRVDLYDEVLNVLEGFVQEVDLLFPISKYLYAASWALIYHQYRQKGIAKKFAVTALDALNQAGAGFSSQPGTKLVSKEDQEIIRRLRKIRLLG